MIDDGCSEKQRQSFFGVGKIINKISLPGCEEERSMESSFIFSKCIASIRN